MLFSIGGSRALFVNFLQLKKKLFKNNVFFSTGGSHVCIVSNFLHQIKLFWNFQFFFLQLEEVVQYGVLSLLLHLEKFEMNTKEQMIIQQHYVVNDLGTFYKNSYMF